MHSDATNDDVRPARTGEQKQPFWARCPSCGHCWPVAYLLMDMAAVARLASGASCPQCGGRKPVVAKQNGGILQEAEAA